MVQEACLHVWYCPKDLTNGEMFVSFVKYRDR